MKVKTIFHLVGITAVAILSYFLLIQVESNIVYNMIIPIAGETINQWIEKFKYLGLVGISVSWVCCFLWYFTAQWSMKVNSYKKAGKRIIWNLIFILPMIAVVVTILLMPQAQEGAWVSYILQFINGAFSYYLGTLLFSPSSFKYAPPLAKVVRRLW